MLTALLPASRSDFESSKQPPTSEPHEPETGPSRFTPQKSDRQQSADQYPEQFVPTNSSVFRAEQFSNHLPSILREAGNLGEVSQNRAPITPEGRFFGFLQALFQKNYTLQATFVSDSALPPVSPDSSLAEGLSPGGATKIKIRPVSYFPAEETGSPSRIRIEEMDRQRITPEFSAARLHGSDNGKQDV
jgi:hypothetical protein